MPATKQEHGNSSALPLPGDAPSVPISSSLPPPLQHLPPLVRNRIPSPSSPTWSTSPAAATPQPFSHVRPLPSIELQAVEVRDQLLTALVCAGAGCLIWVRTAIRQCRPTPTPSRGRVRRGQARLARGAANRPKISACSWPRSYAPAQGTTSRGLVGQSGNTGGSGGSDLRAPDSKIAEPRTRRRPEKLGRISSCWAPDGGG
jgi:hypothetical protein